LSSRLFGRSIIMPRYVFHIQTDTRESDEISTELVGPTEARRQAVQTCGIIMKDSPEDFWGSRPWTVTVTAAEGIVLWETPWTARDRKQLNSYRCGQRTTCDRYAGLLARNYD